jgi:hypothetical protein
MHCADCARQHVATPAVTICRSCGEGLCTTHAAPRRGPGGMSIGCLHGGPAAFRSALAIAA